MRFIVRKFVPAFAALIIMLSASLALFPSETVLAAYSCPTTSTRSYETGTMYQSDPEGNGVVRPTSNHPDKTLYMRNSSGPWTSTTGTLDFWDYDAQDTNSPRFATLFNPTRVPTFTNLYKVHRWNYDGYAPPNPGVVLSTFEKNDLSSAIGNDAYVTALGVATAPGEELRAPTVGYNIGSPWTNGAAVIYADSTKHSITLHFTRDDSIVKGYSVQIDGVCIDPKLQTTYNNKDGGSRYEYDLGHGYPLPGLTAGKVFGTAMGDEIVLVMRDKGAWKDPRDLEDWWRTRPNKGGPGLGTPESNATITSASVTFDWSPVSGNTNPATPYASYQLQVDTDSGFGAPILHDSTQSNTSRSVSLGNGAYYWRVRVDDSPDPSGTWSVVRSFTVDAGATLNSPENGAPLPTDVPVFDWVFMDGSTTNKLEIATDSGFSDIIQSSPTDASTSYTVPGGSELPDGVYFWHVLSYDGGSSLIGMSATRTFTVDTLPPDPPTPLTPVDNDRFTSGPTLTWSAPAGATGYIVQLADNSGFSSPTTKPEQPGASYATSGLALDHYYWRVKARDAAGNWSDFGSYISFGIAPGKPTPTGPDSGSTVTTSTPLLSWTAPASGADHYRLQVDDLKVGEPAWGLPEYDNSSVFGTSHAPTMGAYPDGVYSWRVRGLNADGDLGTNSTVWTFTLNRKPPVVTTIVPNGTDNDNTPPFEWSLSGSGDAAATDYLLTVTKGTDVQSATFDAATYCAATCVADPFSAPTNWPALTDGSYSFTVTPSNGFGSGPASTVRTFKVDTLAPPIPANSLPKNNGTSATGKPALTVPTVSGGKTYAFEVLDTLSAVAYTGSSTTGIATVGPAALDYGVYTWRAKAIDAANNESGWSYPFSLTVSRMTAPANNAGLTDRTPTFTWSALGSASNWDLRYVRDDNPLDTTIPDPTDEPFIDPLGVEVDNRTGPSTSYTVPGGSGLVDSDYYWTLRVNDGTWMPARKFTVSRMTALKPNAVTADTTPTFTWGTVSGAATWDLAYIADPDLFDVVNPDPSTGTLKHFSKGTTLTYIIPSGSALADGVYFWQLTSNSGAPMPPWMFTVTRMQTPKNGSFTIDTTPTFKWGAVAGAGSWDLAYTSDPDGNPTDALNANDTVVHFSSASARSYTVPGGSALTRLTEYYWALRANSGAWMPVWSFVVQ